MSHRHQTRDIDSYNDSHFLVWKREILGRHGTDVNKQTLFYSLSVSSDEEYLLALSIIIY